MTQAAADLSLTIVPSVDEGEGPRLVPSPIKSPPPSGLLGISQGRYRPHPDAGRVLDPLWDDGPTHKRRRIAILHGIKPHFGSRS
jgi:hypothetical protein